MIKVSPTFWKIALAAKKPALSSTVDFQTRCELARAMMERVHPARLMSASIGRFAPFSGTREEER